MEAQLRLKLKKYYKAIEEEGRHILQRKFERATDEQIEWYMKANGIDNPEENLVEFEINRRANAGADWLLNLENEKLFEMAQWNQNKMSHQVVEFRFSTKLDKAQKRRLPQLREIAKENNISF